MLSAIQSGDSKPRIALIGCGAMGTPIGHRLIGLGYRLNVYNRSSGKTASLVSAGAQASATPLEAASSCDVIVSAVTDDAAVEDVLFSRFGALSAPGPARMVIELGTHCPLAVTRIAAQAAAQGVGFIEAPMTGSVHDARQGTLGFLVGASPENLELARPLLADMGKEVFHFGLPGTGNQAKLALNLLVGVMAHGLGEAIALLNAQQLSVPTFLAALDGSGLASPLYRRIGERHLQGDTVARFSLANLEKDMLLVRDRAQALGVSHAAASAVIGPLQDMDERVKQRDYSALIGWIGGRP